ncbi:hypothetical protein Q8A67_009117 [Cirrhinus molitorella]|uniref:G-protein coupled receptors family 1 profile domain-containing protein n=1 Tax=Cirrhinus molitorella TaxID=172907 RepID=A0AA88PUM5_9TELE|nr:hypothetical protein Q8A67_009117 [Cirrhinus molitorella]
MDNITADPNVALKLTCNMTGHHDFIFTFIPVVYSCNFIIGIIGNSLVVTVIYFCLKLKTVANIFVLNLAVSDLTFLLTLPIWAIYTATGYEWLFGDFLCKATADSKDHPNVAIAVAALSLMKGILGYLLPITIILTCYCLIGRSLLTARDIQRNLRSNGDEVLSMLAAAVLSFFLCWTPHQILNFMEMLLLLKVTNNCDVIEIIDTGMPFTICIAFFNSCMNPILYGFVGKNFRRNLLKLLRCSSISVASHPTLSTKMSSLSYQTSESLHLSVTKTCSLPQTT